MNEAEISIPDCDRCGEPCTDGHQLREYGQRDPQTGYIDQEIVCHTCAEEPRDEDEDEDYYAAGDDRFTAQHENKEG